MRVGEPVTQSGAAGGGDDHRAARSEAIHLLAEAGGAAGPEYDPRRGGVVHAGGVGEAA